MILALLALTLGISGATEPEPTGLRQVTLDVDKRTQKVSVAGSLGVATTIVLPDDWVGVPVCGDCAFGADKSGGALWRILLQEDTRTLVVKPIQVPSVNLPPAEFLTNIQLTLANGLSLTFFVSLVHKADADFNITLLLPKSATSSARLSQLEKKLEASFDARVSERVNAVIVENLLHKVTCRDIGNKIARKDGMVVRLQQLCHAGKFLYVTFEVENRKPTPLELGTATLTDPDDNVSGVQHFAKTNLAYNDRSLGIAAFTDLAPDTPHRTYSFRIEEAGGNERSLEWPSLHFGGWF